MSQFDPRSAQPEDDRTMMDGTSFLDEDALPPAPDMAGEEPGEKPEDTEADLEEDRLEGEEGEEDGEDEEPEDQDAVSLRRRLRLQELGGSLYKKFADCEQRRQPIEERWLEDLRQYHGKYDPNTLRQLTDSESCQLFLNITKPKTHAFSARVMDMVLPTDERNWGIEQTPVPELSQIAQSSEPAIDPATGQPMVEPTTGQPVQAKDIAHGMMDEAKDRADAMEEEIDDQLQECQYNSIQRKAIEQMAKLGTGVIMGPIITDEWRTKWEPMQDGTGKSQYVRKTVPNTEKRPAAQWVDVWNFYPDMSAADPTEWGYAFVQYLVNATTLRKMGKRYNFMKEPLKEALAGTPFNVRSISWMNELRDLSDQNVFADERYRLLRYYGEISREDLDAVGIDPDELGVTDIVYGVVWLCDNTVLKVDINPLDSGELPFAVSYCDKDEASPFGTGIPRLMRGEQESVNGAWRMKHDNAGLSVCPQTVIKLNSVKPADGDYQIKPKKLWYAADDVQNINNVFGQFSIDSHQAELDNILQLAIRFADDVTQLPLLMQGDQAPHITQTAQGMSLLYNASTVVLRRTIKFYDDYITVPLISRFYDWNMQFSPREEIKGDFKIIARGSSTLLEKEQQGQAFDMAMQFASSPVWQPYTDMKKLYEMALKSKRIQDIILPDEKIEQNLKQQAEAMAAQAGAAGGQAAPAAPPPPKTLSPELMALEQRKLDLLAEDIASRERVAIANLAAKKGISLLQAQSELAALKVREDSANQRFNNELSMKARVGTGI